MNNTTQIYHSLEYWYETLGSTVIQEVTYLTIIPIGIIGIILNILALFVLKSKKFNMSFYVYLRAYTISSLFICLFNATQFSTIVKRSLTFTNSKLSMQYFSYVYVPLVATVNIYGSSLDVILSIDRVALLSKRMHWFRSINANKLCSTLAIIFTILCIPYWFIFEPTEMTVYLDEKTPVTLHSFIIGSNNSFVLFHFYAFSCVVDIVPIIFETSLNITSIYLIKKYNENRKRMFGKSKSKTENLALTCQSKESSTSKQELKKQKENAVVYKSKKMEIKLTILVIFLSIASIL
jgi:hypothetical protein